MTTSCFSFVPGKVDPDMAVFSRSFCCFFGKPNGNNAQIAKCGFNIAAAPAERSRLLVIRSPSRYLLYRAPLCAGDLCFHRVLARLPRRRRTTRAENASQDGRTSRQRLDHSLSGLPTRGGRIHGRRASEGLPHLQNPIPFEAAVDAASASSVMACSTANHLSAFVDCSGA